MKISREEVLCVNIDGNEKLIRIGSIVELTTDLGLFNQRTTGRIKDIEHGQFVFDWSEPYDSRVAKVDFNSVRFISVIKE